MSLIDTASCGNAGAGPRNVDSSSAAGSYATKISVCYDGDKIRGIQLHYKDATSAQAGDSGNTRYANSEFSFQADETLLTMYLRDSGYGYGSLRQLGFTTSNNRTFAAGPGGFDNEVALSVDKRRLAGFHAWVNDDNFINCLKFKVRDSVPITPVVPHPLFETAAIGNATAAKSQVVFGSNTATARYLGVRWDGEKVRGVRLELTDGTAAQAGGYGDTSYQLTSYTFEPGESLQSLSLGDNGYGYGSLCHLTFTTNKGKFDAGPGGVDSLIEPPALGSSICGFRAWVNQDNFINAFAFRLTDNALFQIKFSDFSRLGASWEPSENGGVVKLAGSRATITIVKDTETKPSSYTKTVKITNGTNVGHCFYSGAATLNVAVFGDGTFEAHFAADGFGTAKGLINGISETYSYANVVEALVRKYAPIMMLNVDEVYWPSTIDSFLPHMIVQKVNGGPQTFYTGPLDRNILSLQARSLGTNNREEGACLRTSADLNSPSDTQEWFNSVKPAYDAVTSYVIVVNGQNGNLDITYWWFFNYNQGKAVAGTSYGNHVSDWEHVKVRLEGVNFSSPGQEKIATIVYDAHGNKTIVTRDTAEFFGSQVAVHLANGSHEAYPHVGVYDLPQNTHDYCKQNPCKFDQRLGKIEIYEWEPVNGGFKSRPADAPLDWKNPGWLEYRGRWGNWEMGSIFGVIARLEKGPGGLWRPGEYLKP